MTMDVRGWIDVDETAKVLLSRVLKGREFLLVPPLHRVPLRAGNVIELVGPSPSAKTQILIQTAIDCILPKEWNGVHYGGRDQMVLFLDLDCRFDILRLEEMLKYRLMEESSIRTLWQQDGNLRSSNAEKKMPNCAYDETLFESCMRRFLYVRCYDSLEFLSALKTLHYRVQMVQEACCNQVCCLMIDSIGSFHWMDRVSSSLPLVDNNRKHISLQNLFETVVQEIKKFLMVHPMLIIATKTIILEDRHYDNDVKWKWPSMHNVPANGANNPQQLPFREFMPPVWQSSVTHRILVRIADDQFSISKHQGPPEYILQWLLPKVSSSDRFVVKNVGIVNVS